MSRFIAPCLLLLSVLILAAHLPGAENNKDVFRQENLAAWCIVPFDGGKRGPEERAAMLERLGFKKFVYDYRKEHVPQWDAEMEALKRHHIILTGWWFPGLNDEGKAILEVIRRHGMNQCDLWVTGNKGTVESEVARLKPVALEAAKLGVKIGLYNHGGWFGEPENLVAIVEALKKAGSENVGIVYNLHHGHGHLEKLDQVLALMKPYLICLNLNGMDVQGDAKGRKILPLGVGTEDVKVLKAIKQSGYAGPMGILNHTDADAEARLQDNLAGLKWLAAQLDGSIPEPKPVYRSWEPAKTEPKVEQKPAANGKKIGTRGAPSLSEKFGKALVDGALIKGRETYNKFPITVECRAKLDSKSGFNILVASEVKSSATHWELYSYKDSGVFSVYLPGRGGEFKSNVDIADGQWHKLSAIFEEEKVQLYVDGKMVLEKVLEPLSGKPIPGDLAFGRLVEGGIYCDGVIDEVRLSIGALKPRKIDEPFAHMDVTLGLWNFDALPDEPLASVYLEQSGPAPLFFKPDRKPLNVADWPDWEAQVNRDRVFDFYSKQAIHFMAQKEKPELLAGYPGLDGGEQGHWGNQSEETWRDDRWSKSDLGNVLGTVIKQGDLIIPKAVCVRLEGDMMAIFDPETLTFPIVQKGGFLKISDVRHGFMGGISPAGEAVPQEAEAKPAGAFMYHGFYRYEDKVIFSYIQGHKEMLDVVSSKDGALLRERAPLETHSMAEMIKGGPSQWPQWIEMNGSVGTGEPFAVDTIPIPFENPYGTLFFISGHDFLSDGTGVVATMTGEVWLVKGLDEKLENVRWKRFATGLHQPLGVRIKDDKIYVLGRDQITRLYDLNDDDEADFYECVSNEQITSAGGHDYITGLEVDDAGYFYFASANQGICRVKPGNQVEVISTGFRNPNGLGLGADGSLTTSVQEGDWTPASAICQAVPGGHFGAGGPKDGKLPELPLLYLPRGEDNSSGGQVFISGHVWEPLRGNGNFVHFSPGAGSAFLVTRQEVNGRWQAAAVRIASGFKSGVQAGRFHPLDGQLYVSGMDGWGSYVPDDGCFQRVRYTGGKVPVATSIEARDNGVLLSFSKPVAATTGEVARHFAQCWNYHYSAAYGSPEYSVKHRDTIGHDVLDIRTVQVLDGGKKVFIEIPQLIPANVIHLHLGVTAGEAMDVFFTAHALDEAFKDYPGYQAITKTAQASAAPVSMGLPPPLKPNPWANGEKGREIIVEAALGLQFVQKELTVKAGEQISLVFKNPDVVPHNWVLSKPGTLHSVGNAVNLLIASPEGLARHYVPDSEEVLVYTDMVNPQENFTIHFTAPTEKGLYPYLCTFPGHWQAMNGVLKVE